MLCSHAVAVLSGSTRRFLVGVLVSVASLCGTSLDVWALPREVERGKEAASELPASVVFARVAPSVVVVRCEAKDRQTQGSGVVVSSDEVITNYHVIEGATAVSVQQGDRVIAATLLAVDPKRDLALLRAPGLDRPKVSTRPSYQAKVGERVYCVGAPRGLELTLSDGIVSALRDPVDRTREGSESEGSRSAATVTGVARGLSKTNKEPSAAAKAVSDSGTKPEVVPGVATIPEYKSQLIQVTTPVSPGSSGGGLFDGQGRLLGIVTFSANGQSLNFAHPSEWIAELRSGCLSAATAAASKIEPQFSVMQRPQHLSCRLQTRAMWALFSSGTELLEEASIIGELRLMGFSQQLPIAYIANDSGRLSLVLSDLDRSAGYVRFALAEGSSSSAISKDTSFFFWVDDEGSFRTTFVEPINFHGQLRLRTVSGVCEVERSKVFQTEKPKGSAPEVLQSELAKGEEQLRRGSPSNALPHFLRACSAGEKAGCIKAATIADGMGLTMKAKELREQADRIPSAK